MILARYYYHNNGFRKKKIYNLLFDFLKRNYPRYELEESYWIGTVEKIASRAGKYPLAEIRGVSISVSEMLTITSIHNKVLERLAFTMLCLAKFWNAKKPNNNGWVNTDSKELFQYARISSKALDREIRIGQLHDMGLLEFPKRNGNMNCRVTFINDEDKNEAMFVSDFRELGYTYLKQKGENFIECAECGILIRNNKNRTKKYCKNCATYTPKETRKILCIDCGKEFFAQSSNTRSIRCRECQHEKQLEYQRKSMKKLRNVK